MNGIVRVRLTGTIAAADLAQLRVELPRHFQTRHGHAILDCSELSLTPGCSIDEVFAVWDEILPPGVPCALLPPARLPVWEHANVGPATGWNTSAMSA